MSALKYRRGSYVTRSPAAALRACIVACAVFAMAPAAWAGPNNCSVTAATHSFGAFDTLNANPGTSSITLTCSTNGKAFTFDYRIALSAGSGSFANRQMSGGGDVLNFNHYTSAAYASVWGDGSAGTVTVTGSLFVPKSGGNTATTILTVFGLIGGPQNVVPAAYATTAPITVTVSAITAGDFPTVTTTFNTNASVAAQCNATAATLGFGSVNPLSSQVDATTSITVNCTKTSAYTVGLDPGTSAGSTIAQRIMANGADSMLYNLYTNSARTSVWGNSAGSWLSGTGGGLTIPQAWTVYGRIAPGQTNLAAGSYQENAITVTVTY